MHFWYNYSPASKKSSCLGLLTLAMLLLLWELAVKIWQLPNYILPAPSAIGRSLLQYHRLLLQQASLTLLVTTLGFISSCIIGSCNALLLSYFPNAYSWLFPLLLISQTLPIFVLAPLLVLWFGYGLCTKIITIIIMLFFPVTSAFYDGLRRIPPQYLDLMQISQAKPWPTLRYIRIPLALPSLATGIRLAAAFAPMGAVIGEWVAATDGLGALLMNSNATMQIELTFAALAVLTLLTLTFYQASNLVCQQYLLKNHHK